MKDFLWEVLVETLFLALKDAHAILIQVVATLIGMCITTKIGK